MANEQVLEELCNSTYVSLKSFKRDGSAVLVPVWSVRDGDALAFMTDANSFKVKRMRRHPEVELARCNASGKKILGAFYAGTAGIAEDEDSMALVRRLLRQKYGWQMRLIDSLSGMRKQTPCMVRIQLA